MGSIVQQLLIQAALILINAFFAMTEIAVISLNGAKLRKMEEEGDKKAARLLKMVEEPSGFLSTIQIGITLAGFLGSAFAAESFSEYLVAWVYEDLGFTLLPIPTLHTLSVIVITIILSYFTLIFGELVPKRIAMQKSYEMARISCGVVSTLAVLMRPVVKFLALSTNGVLRLIGMKAEAEEAGVTEEEIRLMMDLGEEKGTIEHEEREWIENVFDFGECIASTSMTHILDVKAIQIDAQIPEIMELIEQTGLSRFPVYRKDLNDIVGILTVREFLIDQHNPSPRPLADLLRPAYFVPESIKCSVLFRDLQQKKVHLAVVVDEYGETAGIITIEDLLEEIVGNIYDEFDPSEPAEIEKIGDNMWRTTGSVSIESLEEELDIELPEDRDYNTLGGMVFSRLNTIPRDGSSLEMEINGLHIYVDMIENHRITLARVQRVLPAPEQADPS